MSIAGISSGDRTKVEGMTIRVWSDGEVEVTANHSTGLCENIDYIHTSLLFRDKAGAELAVLPRPSAQPGVAYQDEEYCGPPLRSRQSAHFSTKSQPLPSSIDAQLFHRIHSVQVFTRG